ncbi:MAG: ASKHA domain-containing protein, partial [Rhodobacteraceae bacterium]|nr:ASKHA domain-containing protein [Paracoccaceae bacterium]
MNKQHPLIVFSPSGMRGRVAKGTTVLEAARQLGVDLDSVCGGRGICSRCQILPSFGSFPKLGIKVSADSISEWNKVEERYDRVRGLKPGRRLGCQARICGDLAVDVPPESQVHRQVVRKSADRRPVTMDPAVHLYFVEVSQPDMDLPGGDYQRLQTALEEQWGIKNVQLSLQVLSRLQGTLKQGDWKITLAIHQDHTGFAPRVVEIWPGFFGGPLYGLAIDVGSTTVAAQLCNLADGAIAASSGIMNPQIRFGEDLMSRVSYSMLNQSGAADMTSAVRIAVCGLIQSLAATIAADERQIVEVVFVCNPIMHHLLLGIDPVELGQAPFALATDASVQTTARDLELVVLGNDVPVHLLPCIAGHVGADAASVILSEQPHKSEDLVLLVDVGTNAEIVLGDKTRVLACSSPTGPAFEGAQISAGQRASPGAIERVEVCKESLEPKFKVVGCDLWSNEDGFADATAQTGITGICGSGIIEAIAELRMAGVIDKSGLIGAATAGNESRLIRDGRTNAYVLHRS